MKNGRGSERRGRRIEGNVCGVGGRERWEMKRRPHEGGT